MAVLYVAATPIGNLSDISQRAISVMTEADVIIAEDTRHTLALLTHLGLKKRLVSCHKYSEKEKAAFLVDDIRTHDLTAVLVTDAGTPCISDPGFIVVGEAHAAGIKCFPIPGPCAAVSALSVCGFELTDFVFAGFFPRTEKEKNAFLDKAAASGYKVIVFYESPKRIMQSLNFLTEKLPEAPLFVANDITKLHEKYYRGTTRTVAAELSANPNRELGEYTCVLELASPAGEEESNPLSPEAVLVDIMAKNSCNAKQAVALAAENGLLRKNEAYAASLRLKNLFG